MLTGCSNNIPTPNERLNNALSLKEKDSIQKTIKTKNFEIFSLQKVSKECKNINIYIEGDGLAWETRTKISKDPTPINPLGLKLMNVDSSNCKVYIARPCQYTPYGKNCDNKYWTSHRFNSKVIESYDEALSSIKQQYQNNSFALIGYSGGASITLLVAAKRDDIKNITTIAGNINHSFWTKYHRINPLNGSQNPINYTKQLEKIPQYHLIGSNDTIVPKEIFNSYIQNVNDRSNIHFKIYESTHTLNWEQNYKNFLKETK